MLACILPDVVLQLASRSRRRFADRLELNTAPPDDQICPTLPHHLSLVVDRYWIFQHRWDTHGSQFDIKAFLIMSLLSTRTNLTIYIDGFIDEIFYSQPVADPHHLYRKVSRSVYCFHSTCTLVQSIIFTKYIAAISRKIRYVLTLLCKYSISTCIL